MATKYQSARDGCREIAQLIQQTMPRHAVDAVCWVPTAHRHIRQRGYDHARLLAYEIAHREKLPCRSMLIRKKQVTQVGASRAKRQRQMKDAFVAKDGLETMRVLLVDDVVSTAATVEAAARTLKRAGVKRVVVAVAARNR